jgi:signal transduction histidine kinase
MATRSTLVRLSHPRRFAVVFGPALIVVLFGALAYWGALRERRSRLAVENHHRVVETLQQLVTRLVDAETGQRGYLLTGRRQYLNPYRAARRDVVREVASLRKLLRGRAYQQARLDTLARLTSSKFDELAQTVAIHDAGRHDAAIRIVETDRGRQVMGRARRLAAAMQRVEVAELAARSAREEASSRGLLLILAVGTLLAALVSLLLNAWLHRFAVGQQELTASLEAANGQLQEHEAELRTQYEQLEEQSLELEAQSTQLQDQAAELLAQNDHLQRVSVELERRTDAAESANRAKASFLAAMSHDLRTPLNAITGYVQLLEMGLRGPVTVAQVQDLRRIGSSSNRLLALISDILSFARLEAGRTEIHLRNARLDHLLRELESSFLPQLTARGLSYRCQDSDAFPWVRADPERLGQVVLNLVSNAIKFTDPGGSITLSWVADDEFVVIRVRDTGRGIPEEKLQGIFEPFVQVDRERTESASQGVGLGLAISRELVRRQGGELHAESTPGQGSCFSISIGRAIPPHEAAPAERHDGRLRIASQIVSVQPSGHEGALGF